MGPGKKTGNPIRSLFVNDFNVMKTKLVNCNNVISGVRF